MAVVRKRQDDTNLKVLRELVTSGGGNRQCFDCGQKGPTYVNMTIGSFVCTRCSGVLRGLTPPHRVKSISVATFTPDELEFLKAHGNDVCAKTWLGLWDPKRIVHQDQRELMIDKYERKRYYLEPASPLKSLTNATKVSSLSSSNNSISTSGSGSNIINNNGHTNSNNNNNNSNNNNHTNSSNSSNKSSTENNLKSIALTPPTSLRITANGINSSSNSSRSQSRYNFNKNDDNFNHKSSPLVNGIGNSSSSSVTSKNSLNVSLSSGSSNGGQGFTPDSEFVADFSTANIFNAGSQNNLNGFKNHQQAGGLPNGLQAGNFLNGGASTNHIGLANISNVNENFADFDHAPIYNAAAYQNSCNNNFNNMFASSNYFSPNAANANSSSAFNSAVQSCSNNSYISPISSSYSYNVASNGSVAGSAGSNNNSNNSNIAGSISASLGNLQWNVWQQFQWPSFSTSSNIEPNTNTDPNQNRWSLPIPNSSNNSFNSSSATINSNSTPPADRYAALKDLDEQLRESKAAAAVADTFCVQAQPSPANPFKTNPPAQPQQPMNPFQASYNQSSANLFGTQTQNNSSVNAFGTNAAFNVQPISNFNGYTAQTNANGSNSCSFGFGVQQPITAGNAVSNIKNPFATSSLNPNNPFL